MLRAKDIEYSYGSRKVLDGVSFKADRDSIMTILGPNGVGKTTLLKAICGISKPLGGSATVEGTDIYSLNGNALARYIGYVPQSVPRTQMSVFDMVLLGRKPYFQITPTEEDLDVVSEILVRLDLDDLALRYVTEISGGEFQKVQIARAMVQEPKVLVLDEPTNNLDINNQHRTLGLVDDLVNETGMCTIMTMHDINLAAHYSDKMMFIKDGKIAAFGDPDIITPELIKEVYGMRAEVVELNGVPTVIPKGCCRARRRKSGNGHDHDEIGCCGKET